MSLFNIFSTKEKVGEYKIAFMRRKVFVKINILNKDRRKCIDIFLHYYCRIISNYLSNDRQIIYALIETMDYIGNLDIGESQNYFHHIDKGHDFYYEKDFEKDYGKRTSECSGYIFTKGDRYLIHAEFPKSINHAEIGVSLAALLQATADELRDDEEGLKLLKLAIDNTNAFLLTAISTTKGIKGMATIAEIPQNALEMTHRGENLMR